MNTRRTKERFMNDCKTIAAKVESIKKKIGYYPTYREMQKYFDLSYTAIYTIVQEAIKNGWCDDGFEVNYKRSTK